MKSEEVKHLERLYELKIMQKDFVGAMEILAKKQKIENQAMMESLKEIEEKSMKPIEEILKEFVNKFSPEDKYDYFESNQSVLEVRNFVEEALLQWRR